MLKILATADPGDKLDEVLNEAWWFSIKNRVGVELTFNDTQLFMNAHTHDRNYCFELAYRTMGIPYKMTPDGPVIIYEKIKEHNDEQQSESVPS